MKIKPIRSIENDTYTTLIKPLEWGITSMTDEEELAMLEDTPQLLRYADIDFTDKFVIVNGLPTISTDENAVEVKLNLSNKEYLIDENFVISFSSDANKILDSELDSEVFVNRHLLAQARVILFETKIIEKIKELLNLARSHRNSFEETVEQII